MSFYLLGKTFIYCFFFGKKNCVFLWDYTEIEWNKKNLEIFLRNLSVFFSIPLLWYTRFKVSSLYIFADVVRAVVCSDTTNTSDTTGANRNGLCLCKWLQQTI